MKNEKKRYNKIPSLWFFTIIFFAYQFGMRVSIPNVLNSDLQVNFSIGSKELGALISTAYMTYMMMQIPVGMFIDKISLKKIVFFSFFFTSAALITFAYTTNFWIAAIAQIILGIATASGFAMIFKIASICFSQQYIALAVSLALSFSSLCVVGFEIMMAYLTKAFYWKNIVILISIIGIFLSLILLLFVQDIKNTSTKDEQYKKISAFNTAKIIFSEKKFLLIGFFSMMIYGTGSAFSETWGVSFIKNIYNIDIVTATSIVSMHFIGIVIGGPILAYISRLVKSYTKMMIAGSIMLAIFMGVMVFGNVNVKILPIVVFFLGMAASSNNFSFLEAMSLLPKNVGGSVTGTLNTMTMLGSICMIPTVGLIIDFSRGNNTNYSAIDYH
ncbi:MAG: MFS transporter, partial [Alphaproteobacteria bacterium]|nr:MFS transporter [Alphaproteobacteria bacterium]